MTPPTLDDLIEKFTAPLMRAALSLGFSEADAEELVQDTFVGFLKARDRFEGRSQLSTYLFGILYNKAREMRREKDKERSEEDIERVFDAHFSADDHWTDENFKELTEPERVLQAKDVSRYLMECLDRLAMALRVAFTMKEVDGADTETICRVLNVTPNHLGVVLFRARNQMRECLKSKGGLKV